MDGAVYALIVNACVALLFAAAFVTIRLSYQHQHAVNWFVATYFIGMLTPMSELGVRYSQSSDVFVATSYLTLLLSALSLPLGLAAMSQRPLPWRIATGILVAGVIIRVAIWGGHRNDLGYEMAFQAPFVASSVLSTAVAVGAVRRRSSRLWTAVGILFALMTAYFATKPIFANIFGSGATAKAYASSAYALFSQATGGVLVITAGLLVLLIAVENAMGRSIIEAETDPLTGIANRRGFERQAERVIADARRTESPLALIMFDLDHFKRVNDSFGHAMGDAVIRSFAELLTSTGASSAVAARIGGEEFVMLLDRTTQRGAWHVAERIREVLSVVGPHLPTVTVSAGIACLRSGDTIDDLLHRADQNTYDAKIHGRNRTCPTPAATFPERADLSAAGVHDRAPLDRDHSGETPRLWLVGDS